MSILDSFGKVVSRNYSGVFKIDRSLSRYELYKGDVKIYTGSTTDPNSKPPTIAVANISSSSCSLTVKGDFTYCEIASISDFNKINMPDWLITWSTPTSGKAEHSINYKEDTKLIMITCCTDLRFYISYWSPKDGFVTNPLLLNGFFQDANARKSSSAR